MRSPRTRSSVAFFSPSMLLALVLHGCSNGGPDTAAQRALQLEQDSAADSGWDDSIARIAYELCGDGADNDGDGEIDELCGDCDAFVTRDVEWWVEADCVIDGDANGVATLPLTLGASDTYETAADVVAALAASDYSGHGKLQRNLLALALNADHFDLWDVEVVDWEEDGTGETVAWLWAQANASYDGGSNWTQNFWASQLRELNMAATGGALWFDATCEADPEYCNGVDDDGDGEVDEDCACEELCDGWDNDGDGEIDEGWDDDGDGIADCHQDCPEALSFDDPAIVAGMDLSDAYSWYGVTISVSGGAGFAVAFDSSDPTGEDEDLGTPNEVYGGPGEGVAGDSNQWAQGNLLIIAEDSVDDDGDGLVDDPDDSASGGVVSFTFDQDVCLTSLDLVDIDATESAVATAYDSAGVELASVAASALGDNSWQQLTFDVCGVAFLDVALSGSGAMDELVFCPGGTEEVCDGLDNDGDGSIDEGFTDTDGDGEADCVEVEECDGDDDDLDGETDEGCAACELITTRGPDFWTDAACALAGDLGINPFPVSIGSSVVYSTAEEVATFLASSPGGDATLRLERQLLTLELNIAFYGLADTAALDLDGDGTVDTFGEIAAAAHDVYDTGLSWQKASMATDLRSVNQLGELLPSWFDESCDGAICDGLEIDEDCGCVEVCDGLDNDSDGEVDEGFDSDDDGVADCDDEEECDGLDNDGDGEIDEDGVCDPPPLQCEAPDECLSIWQAHALGVIEITSGGPSGELVTVSNTGTIYDVCLDEQVLYSSFDTQSFFWEEEITTGPTTLAPGDSHNFYYGSWTTDNGSHSPHLGEDAWWCVDNDTYTSSDASFEYTGEGVPEDIAEIILAGRDVDSDSVDDRDDWAGSYGVQTQYEIWSYQAGHAVLSVGKVGDHNEDSCGVDVNVYVRNLGDVAGSGTVTDTVPAGWTVGDFSVTPDSQTVNGDGTQTLTWTVSLDGKLDNPWDIETLGYTLTYDAGADLGYLGLDPATVDYDDGEDLETSHSMPVGLFDLDLDCDDAVECPVEEVCDDIDNDHDGEIDELAECVDEEYCVQEYSGDDSLHAVWLPGIDTGLIFTDAGTFDRDSDGTATFTGTVWSNTIDGAGFDVAVVLTDFTDVAEGDSPKLELGSSSYVDGGGSIDPGTWVYYAEFTGTLTGVGVWAGAEITVARMGPAFQVGDGASGKDGDFGGSGWLTYSVVSGPSSGEVWSDGTGDFNVDFVDCVEECNGLDDDGDGFVDEGYADTDGDGMADCVDEEECDGLDNDGDGDVDEGYADTDGDGTADCVDEEECDGLDNDGDGDIDEGYADTDGDGTADCVDEEECDGLDNDGDGDVDEGYADTDGDGTADCVDEEECDGLDNDGDGDVDEGYADTDGDGTADCVDEEECDGLDNDGDGDIDEGFDSDDDGTADCYDEEECDGVDNDGDGEIDEGFDSDEDGIVDCEDEEECDGVDNDGDGEIDEGFDSDEDGIADCFDEEECDGLDNDGDGEIDEGLACSEGFECVEEYEGDSPHSLVLPGIYNDFLLHDVGVFESFSDGTAIFSGTAWTDDGADTGFDFEVSFSGWTDVPPADSPKLELSSGMYVSGGGTVDPDSWTYYTDFSGTLTGFGDWSGAEVTIDKMGPAFQVGEGANGKNANDGGSGWLTWTVLSQPDAGDLWDTEGTGDINVDFVVCDEICDGDDDDGDNEVDEDNICGDGFCDPPVECLTLWQAHSLDLLLVESGGGGEQVVVTNLSDEYSVCLDEQVAYYSDDTQAFFWGWEVITDGTEIGPGGTHTLYYGSYTTDNGVYSPYLDEPDWWCLQSDDPVVVGAAYSYFGQGVPDDIAAYAQAGFDTDSSGTDDLLDWIDYTGVQAQFNIWDYQSTHLALTVGKLAALSGTEVQVTLTVHNFGEVDGSGVVTDVVPAGWSLTGAAPTPDSTVGEVDGSATVEWTVTVPGMVGASVSSETISYTMAYDAGTDLGYLELDVAGVEYDPGDGALELSLSVPAAVYNLDLDGDGNLDCPDE